MLARSESDSGVDPRLPGSSMTIAYFCCGVPVFSTALNGNGCNEQTSRASTPALLSSAQKS